MSAAITLALDAMGGDFGAEVVVPAALDALSRHESLFLILVGASSEIKSRLETHRVRSHPRLSIHHATQVVGMDESPSQSLRSKKDSSMRVALDIVKEGKAQACVSAGNTGALMATARFVLKTLPGVSRPAILAALPTVLKKDVYILDLGANVDSSSQHLFQFAVMGSVITSAMTANSNPTVGLLNIGEEEIKGNEQVKQTAQLLLDSKAVNYYGFVEGDDIYKGTVDVVVCDGFVGNILLKASEGVVKLLAESVKAAFYKNYLTKFIGLAAMPILQSVRENLDPDRYNGASLVGLQGVVIKSHGRANRAAFSNAIDRAMLEVGHDVVVKISTRVEKLLATQSDKPSP